MINTRTEDENKNEPIFEIKNNILIGKELKYPEKCNNIGEIVFEIFKSKPDFIGQIEAACGRRATYKEMLEKSVKCATWLRKKGIKPGDTVAVCCSSYFDDYVPFLACLYIGAPCAIEYQNLPARSFRHFLSTTRPKLIFLHNSDIKTFTTAQKELNINVRKVVFDEWSGEEESFNEILSTSTTSEVEKFRCEQIVNPKALALLLGTSGSTGLPKMAELSHLSLKTLIDPAYIDYALNLSTCMCAASMRWIIYFLSFFIAVRGNLTRIIAEDKREITYYYNIIKKYRVELYFADSSQMKEMYKFGLIENFQGTDLKCILFGGSPISRDIHRMLIDQLPRINIFQAYGSTDAANIISAQKRGCKPGSCGYVRPGTKIKITCRETGCALGPNKEGEICIMSPAQLNGYFNNLEATSKAIDSEGWLHMNDIGYYDEDGELFIIGRVSDFINYKDTCLSVSEMEAVLDMHPAVCKSAVIPISSETDGELPIAIVKKLPDKQLQILERLQRMNYNKHYAKSLCKRSTY
ncbi:luciferin 4-monooxygenase-like isoform X2 [Ceratina calcarata]|uniref:Luciferin 4-monooxygenase-like isoform X2 n=1 Tax=Ceratina calcarata TaxID=156304 RepID=A0AAJ7WCL3_9HYME|nr:luciferin 4-monooxygenase-like isoform X2 [Ceratina calcarata]